MFRYLPYLRMYDDMSYAAQGEGERNTLTQTLTYVTRHEKTGLMYTKYTRSYKTEYLHYCTSYLQSASCIRFCRNDCISG